MSNDPDRNEDAPVEDGQFAEAVLRRDVATLWDCLRGREFLLISVQEEDDPDSEEEVGALTADVDGHPALVAFSSQENAEAFISAVDDLFDESDEVEGFFVPGEMLLDYLPDGYGMLFDPETDDAVLVDESLAGELLSSQAADDEGTEDPG